MHFRGEYDFLSNFYKCNVEHEGVIYSSVENAFQAAKTLDLIGRRNLKIVQLWKQRSLVRKLSYEATGRT